MKQRAVALAIAQAMEPEKRLQRAKAYIKGVGVISPLNKTAQLAAAGEIASSCDINAIKSMLEKPCWKNHKAHSCLDAFKGLPHAVRNWRMLWASLPRTRRAELMIKLRNQEQDIGMLTFMGVAVCQKAFMMLSGVGASTLLAAKGKASTGLASVWSSKELLQGMLVKNTNKEAKYLDCRSWLELYADQHAEQSPMSGAFLLPSGRKSLYWMQYKYERQQQGISPADYTTFLKAWRVECPHIVVCKSVSMFTRCGLCDYLQEQLARTPHCQKEVVSMLRHRLGKHYEFQSAQRLAMARIEEKCRRSGGAEWQGTWPLEGM